MKYFVFEAGSRCGLSAELFFRQFKDSHSCDHSIVLVDSDFNYVKMPTEYHDTNRLLENDAIKLLESDSKQCSIFPADELARQSKSIVTKVANKNDYSRVKPILYNKKEFTQKIQDIGNRLVHIPKVFDCDNVFLRPNTMSAGSKGLLHLDNYCVTEYKEFVAEYVIDVDNTQNTPIIYPRKVSLKNGYDNYIQFVSPRSIQYAAIFTFVVDFVNLLQEYKYKIFHIQLGEDKDGNLWYIESPKRISGTSAVNMLLGYNPFASIKGVDSELKCRIDYSTIYKYDYLLMKLSEIVW